MPRKNTGKDVERKAGGDCCKGKKGQRVSVKEFGKKLIVDLAVPNAKSTVCRVDGCLIKKGLAPDFAVEDSAKNVLLVELKGKDVVHALTQIEAGFLWWKKERGLDAKRAGVVVCNEVPREQSRIQIAKLKLAREYGAATHIFSRDTVEETFSRLLEFA